jgi:zinc transporter, ZIP family
MAPWAEAGLWGFVAGIALVIGAGLGYYLDIPRRVVAGVMAFGSGVLISALSFELMEVAFTRGGIEATALGLLVGATIFTLANRWLASRGAKHRKRSGDLQASEADDEGSGLAIALGALLDGVPESIVIGLGLLGGASVEYVTVAAIFLSNLPEGLSSASGMKRAGRGPRYVFGVWGSIAIASGLAAIVGYVGFDQASAHVVAAVTAVAAGGILAMLVDTMIPEAFADAHEYSGLIAVIGFLVSFTLSKVGP